LSRESPYAVEHDASVNRKAAPPRKVADLVRWMLEGFRGEMPAAIHAEGVWREYVTQARAPGGGSLLGSKRYTDDFRQFLEGSPFALAVAEYEGHKALETHYRTPMRAAIARVSGYGKAHDDRPFMARTLYRTCLLDGDWDTACASMGIPKPVRHTYIRAALRRLWQLYLDEPNDRPMPDEDIAA
jgi:hypothetical protein